MSKNVKKRWKNNGNGYAGCIHFYNAIKKYGWNNFEHVVLQDCLTKTEANLLEKELIAKYHTQDANYGYNIASGGEGSLGIPRKFGKEHHASKPVYQYDLDGNFIRVWENAGCVEREIGISTSDISSVARGKLYTAGDYIWRYELSDNVSSYHKRQYRNKKIYQLDKNLNIIQTFKDMYVIDKKLFNINTITKCCNKVSLTHKGYFWCFEEDYTTFEEYLNYRINNRCNNLKKRVNQYDVNYNILNTYVSGKEAALKNDINPITMTAYCSRGEANYGFNTTGCYWRYAEDMNNTSTKKEVV